MLLKRVTSTAAGHAQHCRVLTLSKLHSQRLQTAEYHSVLNSCSTCGGGASAGVGLGSRLITSSGKSLCSVTHCNCSLSSLKLSAAIAAATAGAAAAAGVGAELGYLLLLVSIARSCVGGALETACCVYSSR
jgi:hypothetical protein